MKQSAFVSGLLTVILALGCYAAAGDECPPVGGLNFLCGPVAAEDLVRVPGTHWIVGSGMVEKGRSGRLHLIDADKKTWEIFYPGENPQNELDAKTYDSCPAHPMLKPLARTASPSGTTANGPLRFSPSITAAKPSRCSGSMPRERSPLSAGLAVCRWIKAFP